MNQNLLYLVATVVMSVTAGAVWYVMKTFTEEFRVSKLFRYMIISTFVGLLTSLVIPNNKVSLDMELSISSIFALIAYPLLSNIDSYWRAIANAVFRLFNVPIQIGEDKHMPAPMPPKISDQNLQDQENKISNP